MNEFDELRRLAGIGGGSEMQPDNNIIIEESGRIIFNGSDVGIAKIETQMGHEVITYDTTDNFAPVKRAVPNLPALISNAIYEWSQKQKATDNEHNDSSRSNLFG